MISDVNAARSYFHLHKSGGVVETEPIQGLSRIGWADNLLKPGRGAG
jgi:hypothetical protein